MEDVPARSQASPGTAPLLGAASHSGEASWESFWSSALGGLEKVELHVRANTILLNIESLGGAFIVSLIFKSDATSPVKLELDCKTADISKGLSSVSHDSTRISQVWSGAAVTVSHGPLFPGELPEWLASLTPTSLTVIVERNSASSDDPLHVTLTWEMSIVVCPGMLQFDKVKAEYTTGVSLSFSRSVGDTGVLEVSFEPVLLDLCLPRISNRCISGSLQVIDLEVSSEHPLELAHLFDGLDHLFHIAVGGSWKLSGQCRVDLSKDPAMLTLALSRPVTERPRYCILHWTGGRGTEGVAEARWSESDLLNLSGADRDQLAARLEDFKLVLHNVQLSKSSERLSFELAPQIIDEWGARQWHRLLAVTKLPREHADALSNISGFDGLQISTITLHKREQAGTVKCTVRTGGHASLVSGTLALSAVELLLSCREDEDKPCVTLSGTISLYELDVEVRGHISTAASPPHLRLETSDAARFTPVTIKFDADVGAGYSTKFQFSFELKDDLALLGDEVDINISDRVVTFGRKSEYSACSVLISGQLRIGSCKPVDIKGIGMPSSFSFDARISSISIAKILAAFTKHAAAFTKHAAAFTKHAAAIHEAPLIKDLKDGELYLGFKKRSDTSTMVFEMEKNDPVLCSEEPVLGRIRVDNVRVLLTYTVFEPGYEFVKSPFPWDGSFVEARVGIKNNDLEDEPFFVPLCRMQLAPPPDEIYTLETIDSRTVEWNYRSLKSLMKHTIGVDLTKDTVLDAVSFCAKWKASKMVEGTVTVTLRLTTGCKLQGLKITTSSGSSREAGKWSADAESSSLCLGNCLNLDTRLLQISGSDGGWQASVENRSGIPLSFLLKDFFTGADLTVIPQSILDLMVRVSGSLMLDSAFSIKSFDVDCKVLLEEQELPLPFRFSSLAVELAVQEQKIQARLLGVFNVFQAELTAEFDLKKRFFLFERKSDANLTCSLDAVLWQLPLETGFCGWLRSFADSFCNEFSFDKLRVSWGESLGAAHSSGAGGWQVQLLGKQIADGGLPHVLDEVVRLLGGPSLHNVQILVSTGGLGQQKALELPLGTEDVVAHHEKNLGPFLQNSEGASVTALWDMAFPDEGLCELLGLASKPFQGIIQWIDEGKFGVLVHLGAHHPIGCLPVRDGLLKFESSKLSVLGAVDVALPCGGDDAAEAFLVLNAGIDFSQPQFSADMALSYDRKTRSFLWPTPFGFTLMSIDEVRCSVSASKDSESIGFSGSATFQYGNELVSASAAIAFRSAPLSLCQVCLYGKHWSFLSLLRMIADDPNLRMIAADPNLRMIADDPNLLDDFKDFLPTLDNFALVLLEANQQLGELSRFQQEGEGRYDKEVPGAKESKDLYGSELLGALTDKKRTQGPLLFLRTKCSWLGLNLELEAFHSRAPENTATEISFVLTDATLLKGLLRLPKLSGQFSSVIHPAALSLNLEARAINILGIFEDIELELQMERSKKRMYAQFNGEFLGNSFQFEVQLQGPLGCESTIFAQVGTLPSSSEDLGIAQSADLAALVQLRLQCFKDDPAAELNKMTELLRKEAEDAHPLLGWLMYLAYAVVACLTVPTEQGFMLDSCSNLLSDSFKVHYIQVKGGLSSTCAFLSVKASMEVFECGTLTSQAAFRIGTGDRETLANWRASQAEAFALVVLTDICLEKMKVCGYDVPDRDQLAGMIENQLEEGISGLFAAAKEAEERWAKVTPESQRSAGAHWLEKFRVSPENLQAEYIKNITRKFEEKRNKRRRKQEQSHQSRMERVEEAELLQLGILDDQDRVNQSRRDYEAAFQNNFNIEDVFVTDKELQNEAAEETGSDATAEGDWDGKSEEGSVDEGHHKSNVDDEGARNRVGDGEDGQEQQGLGVDAGQASVQDGRDDEKKDPESEKPVSQDTEGQRKWRISRDGMECLIVSFGSQGSRQGRDQKLSSRRSDERDLWFDFGGDHQNKWNDAKKLYKPERKIAEWATRSKKRESDLEMIVMLLVDLKSSSRANWLPSLRSLAIFFATSLENIRVPCCVILRRQTGELLKLRHDVGKSPWSKLCIKSLLDELGAIPATTDTAVMDSTEGLVAEVQALRKQPWPLGLPCHVIWLCARLPDEAELDRISGACKATAINLHVLTSSEQTESQAGSVYTGTPGWIAQAVLRKEGEGAGDGDEVKTREGEEEEKERGREGEGAE